MKEISNFAKSGINTIPEFYNHFFSHAKLSDKRKEDISLRRDQLKVRHDDPPTLRIVIEEILSYKPRILTLDDRYIQLEKILDAIDKSRLDRNMDDLILVCSEVFKELSHSSDKLNIFLKCLERINARVPEMQANQLKPKL